MWLPIWSNAVLLLADGRRQKAGASCPGVIGSDHSLLKFRTCPVCVCVCGRLCVEPEIASGFLSAYLNIWDAHVGMKIWILKQWDVVLAKVSEDFLSFFLLLLFVLLLFIFFGLWTHNQPASVSCLTSKTLEFYNFPYFCYFRVPEIIYYYHWISYSAFLYKCNHLG